MQTIKVKKLQDNVELPTQANHDDAGFDVRAAHDVIIRPHATVKIGTGLAVEIPEGHELQVRSKSGMAYKEGLVVAQGVGTIDSGYRGEICVLLFNRTPFTKRVKKDEQIAQLVLKPILRTEWVEVSELAESERMKKGFGSTKEEEKTKETA